MKRIIALVLTVLLCFSLCACNGNSSNSEKSIKEKNNSSSADLEDGTELTQHPAQLLPYTKNDKTITSVKITKEHNDELIDNSIKNFKYNVSLEGIFTNEPYSLYVTFSFDKGDILLSLNPGLESYNFTVDDNGHFTLTGSLYSNFDYEYFAINNL